MPEPLFAAMLIMLAAAVTGIGLPLVLRSLPEPPANGPDSGSSAETRASGASGELTDQELADQAREPAKIAYADLIRPGFLIGCVAAVGLAAAIGVLWMPREVVAVWLVLAVFGVSLAAIDSATTWLPMRLSYAAWLAMGIAITMISFVTADAGWLLRTVAGAAIAGAIYLIIWAFSRGGFGFGDVRFAPLLGAAAASASWTLLLWGLLCGALIGGAFGLIRMIIRRPGGFPYAPSMLAGVYLAVVLTQPPPFG